MMLTSSSDAAYAAGIIDGEGTILIESQHGNGTKAAMQLTVRVAMNNVAVLEWLREHFSGFLTAPPAHEASGKHKQLFYWTVKSRKAAAFLLVIRPYLKAKLAQADVGIVLQGMKHWGGCGKYYFSEERAAIEQLLKEKISSLKHEDSSVQEAKT